MCGLLEIFFLEIAIILFISGVNGIMGGYDTIPGQHPYQASLRRVIYDPRSKERLTENFCGGAVLNRRWIITAAQCTTQTLIPKLSDLLIGAGELSFLSNKDFYGAELIVRHRHYNSTDQYLKFNIALIRTSSDIQFSKNFQPLPLSKDWVNVTKGGIVSGWGLRDQMLKSEYSRFAYVSTLSNEDCIEKYGESASEFVDDYILCGYSRYGVGLCHGDAGDPFTLNNRLIGIALWDVPESSPCAIGKPNFFIRISSYISWIENYVNVNIV